MKQSEHSKQFILALQPHEAFPSHRKSAWSPAYLCLGLILLMGLAFSAPTAVNITSPTDADGWEDINLSNTNIQIYNDEFSIQHDSVECVVDSNDTNWVVVNCTGIEFNFYDDAGEYIVEGNTEDISESSEQEFGTNLTYNAGTHVQINNTPVTFGTLGAGTIDNLNTNSPAFNIQNCGNVNLNMTVTGSNITDGDSNSISESQFRVNDGIMTNLILSEEALDYSTSGGQSIGASSLREFSFLANIPVAQPQTIYNTGTWTFIVSPS